jgi:hypothetical protein
MAAKQADVEQREQRRQELASSLLEVSEAPFLAASAAHAAEDRRVGDRRVEDRRVVVAGIRLGPVQTAGRGCQ